jgi:predicted transcriptional regulator
MAKKITIDAKPTTNISKYKETTDKIDKWVETGSTQLYSSLEKSEQYKKITLNVSDSLHKKIKIFCVQNNIKIKDKLLEVIEKEFSQ